MRHTPSKSLQRSLILGVAIAIAMLFIGCSLIGGGSNGATDNYNAESWREVIPAGCVAYFDGCNTCARNLQTGDTACTQKACKEYQQPRCLDGTKGAADAPVVPRVVQFRCNNNKRFTIYYGNYHIGEKTIALKDTQVVYVDAKTRIAEVMTLEPTASGDKFVSGELMFWSDGEEATLNKGRDLVYGNCSVSDAS